MRPLRTILASGLVTVTALSLAALLSSSACSSDPAVSVPEGCSVLVSPSADDATALLTAFIEAQSGDVICLAEGNFSINRQLTISNVANITMRGVGDDKSKVVLDFAEQLTGTEGIMVESDGFIIENMTLKNSPGNGIKVGADLSTFRDLMVTWDGEPRTENGHYAVYPNTCKRTIVEDTEVYGASDAGIYVGSCEYAIVRNNKVWGNVAGIEIENTLHADVYNNETWDNSAGILLFLLPNLPAKLNSYVLVRDNIIRDNNRPNFAAAGTIVANVPTGLGMLLLAGTDYEVRDNTITGNISTGVLAISYQTFEMLSGTELDDPDMDPYLERIYVHDNTFSANGADPQGGLKLVGQATLEDVIWDGFEREVAGYESEICLGTSPPSFRMIAVEDAFDPDKQSTDTTGHECVLDPLPEMEDFDGVTL